MNLGIADWIVNALVLAVAAAFFLFLERRVLRRSTIWRATVTPLASIIGSGFLVVVPLFGFTVGNWALVAIAVIVGLAYLVGGAVRYNIIHVEDITEAPDHQGGVDGALVWMGRFAKLALAGAYVIAITFYLELLGAFVLRLGDIQNPILQKLIASVLIAFIGAFGFWRGLRMLEFLEEHAVDTKLAIIAGLLIGLIVYNGRLAAGGEWALPEFNTNWSVDTVRELLGAFLIVQGFETSRYLRGAYSHAHRVMTMFYAQWIAAGIYIAFVALATVLLGTFETISETGIITLSAKVALVLPFLLIIGAAMSQFSAAVADTIGMGGLVEEVTYGTIKRNYAYAGGAVLALGLLWSSDIFAVIAYASRAFALYYAVQCAMAALHAGSGRNGRRRPALAAFFVSLAFVMLLTAIFGIPAESAGGR